MTREQAAKVAELIRQGWKVLIPEDPLIRGAPTRMASPDGKEWLIGADGAVAPLPGLPAEGEGDDTTTS